MSERETRLNEEEIEELRGNVRALHDYFEDLATQNVAQTAYSTDGRTFDFVAPLSLPMPVGSYSELETSDGERYLGQIVTKAVVERDGAELGFELNEQERDLFPEGVSISSVRDRLQILALEGSGVLLGKVFPDAIIETSSKDTFQKATLSRADAALVERYLTGSGSKARLPIGKALYVDGDATVRLNAGGFGRHTFLCGQSGSGKTFSLGIVLEQLLLETDLRIIVIDPNSDFVSLGRVRPRDEVNRFRSDPLSAEEYDRIAERYRNAMAGLTVYRPETVTTDGEETLRVRFGDLSRSEQATVMELDPLEDREEYNAFWQVVDDLDRRDYSWDEVRNAIAYNYAEVARQLGLRIENLGLADWEVWCSPGESSLIDRVAQADWRCLVLDVGTLGSPTEKWVVANAVLTHLWRERNQRRPTLIVVDEAHNICPHDPVDDLQAASTETAVRIAAEGRKFGLYLLLSTQRPGKIHDNILSQCDNLVLMRMNSHADLAQLSTSFSQVPASLLDESSKFGLGETVLGGPIVPNPTFARFEGRLSEEGGSDIPSTWAEPSER